jgi:cell division protein FtsL
MSWFGSLLLLFGILAAAVPVCWIVAQKLQTRSDKRYQRQQDRLEQRYR